MILDHFDFIRDKKSEYPKIHPTQKPVNLLKKLIRIYSPENAVVCDPVCGSGSTLRAAYEMGRDSYGFESDMEFYTKAKEQMLAGIVE